MSEGEILGVWLLVIIAQALAWGLVDYLIWRKDQQTLSRWVIQEAKKRRRFAWTILGLLAIAQGVVIWLLLHFRLLEFLF